MGRLLNKTNAYIFFKENKGGNTMALKKGYLINEFILEDVKTYGGFNTNCRARVGVEVDYYIMDGLMYLKSPRVYLRLLNNVPFLFIYLDKSDAVKYSDELEYYIKSFFNHLLKLELDEEYNKRIVKYFNNLRGYPEDVLDGLYYEFNETD